MSNGAGKFSPFPKMSFRTSLHATKSYRKQYALLRSTGVRVGGGAECMVPPTPSLGGGAVPPASAAYMAGSRHGPALLGSAGPSLQLGTETVAASDQVRVVGVTLTSDLCLDKHVASVCATCFYWLRQLRPVRRSLDAESAATLVHAFVTSRMDYCNTILAGESPV